VGTEEHHLVVQEMDKHLHLAAAVEGTEDSWAVQFQAYMEEQVEVVEMVEVD
jgi:hypothetical protein